MNNRIYAEPIDENAPFKTPNNASKRLLEVIELLEKKTFMPEEQFELSSPKLGEEILNMKNHQSQKLIKGKRETYQRKILSYSELRKKLDDLKEEIKIIDEEYEKMPNHFDISF